MVFENERNKTRKKQGHRFSEECIQYNSLLRLTGGPKNYRTSKANNIHGVPSLSTIKKNIRKNESQIVEGVLRCEELKKHLIERDLPLLVSLSEDATRVTGKIEYSVRSNTLVGFVLPISTETSMPIPTSYLARSAAEVESHFLNKTSVGHNVNVIMAQPLALNEPPFCLLVYCSDNQYPATVIERRWTHIIDKLATINIKVLTIASDGDPKYNSVMRYSMGLGIQDTAILPNMAWFNCSTVLGDTVYVQDSDHVGTKGRNRLLSAVAKLRIGRYKIDVNHLHRLIQQTKGQSGLTPSVISPADRQNSASVEKICDLRVRELLEQYIKDSNGTVAYLKILESSMSAFLSLNIPPLERVNRIWYAIHMLRIWRTNILKHKTFTLDVNFITTNLYACIELNGHSLIALLLYLKEIGAPHCFFPPLYGSQPCEHTFRLIRSMTPTNSTVVNCSTKGFIERTQHLQYANQLITVDLSKYVFPDLNAKVERSLKSSEVIKELPTEDEIIKTVELAKNRAIQDAAALGLSTKAYDEMCHLNILEVLVQKPKMKTDQRTRIQVHPNCNFTHEDLTEEHKTLKSIENPRLKNCQRLDPSQVEIDSQYVVVSTKKGDICAHKTSLCNLFTDPSSLSSDRRLRVKQK